MALQKAALVTFMVLALSATAHIPMIAAYTPSPAPSGPSNIRYSPTFGGQRILPNGTTIRGGTPFDNQTCPPGSFAKEITLTQEDSTRLLTGISFRCSDASSTVVSEISARGDPASGPQTSTSAEVSEGSRGFNQISALYPYNNDDEEIPFIRFLSFQAPDGTIVSGGNNDTSGYQNPGGASFSLSYVVGFGGRKSDYFDGISIAYAP